ncbi:MAG: glycosyltransferase, partial [Clostridia bacterium]|nr:glycosyltransferase [Clostridia bacterium]
MKVVLISPLPPPVGGVATWTQAYLEAAGDAGFQTVCVNTNYEGRTQLVTGRRSIRDELKRAARIWRDVRRKVRSEAPDVVHLCSACSLTGNLRDLITFGVARAACRSARLILHCHCSLQDYVGGSGLNRRVFRWLCRRTDSVLVLNRQSQRYAEELGVRGVRCVPNFAAGPEVEPADAPDQDDCFRVLFLGRTTFDKGFDVLAEVARRMQEANRR